MAVAVADPLGLIMEDLVVPVAVAKEAQVLVERALGVKELMVQRDEVQQAPTMAVVAGVHLRLVPVVPVPPPATVV
jgi:hypothetical protein